MKLSVLFPETRSVDNVVALAQTTEQLGFHGMFLGTAFGIDPIMALAYAGTQTSRVSLGVAVVPTWPRHPQVLAQQAATANAMCQGRFRLGVGPSHAPVMARLGIPFDRPISHLREYLTIVPNVRRGADDAGRSAPPVIAEVPVALTNDLDELRAMAARDLFIYPMMPFYRAQWEAAGVPRGDRTVAGGWSDEMIEVSLLYGDEDALAAKIKTYFDAGADEVVVSPYGVGEASLANRDDCLRVLSDIVQG